MRISLFLAWVMFIIGLFLVMPVQAQTGSVLGVHILSPDELDSASDLIKSTAADDDWHYVTIPLTLNDLDKKQQWQDFMVKAKAKKIVPLVRLGSRFENEAWQVPNRREVTQLIDFLSALKWPTEERHIIVFNEVNHAKEWGNRIDPAEYAEVLRFTSNWARSEGKNYVVLPAAMDLAAPNGRSTKEAFGYLNEMLAADPEIFETIDAWNSHSYPNPGFSSSPRRTGQNSLRGFEVELAYLKNRTDRDWEVYITETGWEVNRATSGVLRSYYTYALQNIWSHPQVKAVTPFLLRGAPGPFAQFSFYDQHGRPTLQYQAFTEALKQSQLDT